MESRTRFPYSPGESFSRSEMHSKVGGSFRHGMTSCNKGADFLLFYDTKNSKKFGYDKWEGAQADGTFHYTGQGTKGDQKLTRSNKQLLLANQNGLPIHLIESRNGLCTYLSQVVLGSPNFFMRTAKDVEQLEDRNVFVFNLIPILMSQDLDVQLHQSHEVTGLDKPWVSPSFEPTSKVEKLWPGGEISREENKLQGEFGLYLNNLGHEVFNHEFIFSGFRGSLKPDFWIESMGLVVEAKPSAAREFVRLAIGQVLDYANLAQIEGKPMNPAILLPNRPTTDLLGLMAKLHITVIYKNVNDFIFMYNSPTQSHS